MCAGGSDARRWHNAWEQWVLVEAGEAGWHLVDYQAGDDDFTVGQMLDYQGGDYDISRANVLGAERVFSFVQCWSSGG